MKSWRLINEFNDEIFRDVAYRDRTMKIHFSYWHWDRTKNKKIFGALNKVKKHINDKRGAKSSWTESYV